MVGPSWLNSNTNKFMDLGYPLFIKMWFPSVMANIYTGSLEMVRNQGTLVKKNSRLTP